MSMTPFIAFAAVTTLAFFAGMGLRFGRAAAEAIMNYFTAPAKTASADHGLGQKEP